MFHTARLALGLNKRHQKCPCCIKVEIPWRRIGEALWVALWTCFEIEAKIDISPRLMRGMHGNLATSLGRDVSNRQLVSLGMSLANFGYSALHQSNRVVGAIAALGPANVIPGPGFQPTWIAQSSVIRCANALPKDEGRSAAPCSWKYLQPFPGEYLSS